MEYWQMRYVSMCYVVPLILDVQMGLGKTIQTVCQSYPLVFTFLFQISLFALLHSKGEFGPHLIVVPASSSSGLCSLV